eukprot:353880-Chlamydomonas_euryale.AAC.19
MALPGPRRWGRPRLNNTASTLPDANVRRWPAARSNLLSVVECHQAPLHTATSVHQRRGHGKTPCVADIPCRSTRDTRLEGARPCQPPASLAPLS